MDSVTTTLDRSNLFFRETNFYSSFPNRLGFAHFLPLLNRLNLVLIKETKHTFPVVSVRGADVLSADWAGHSLRLGGVTLE